ncbi:acyl-CoA dehydrogenase [Phreatobacter stygius]|uniref:Acyl-CoA dehydrogenase n=1 Tax=Phreatobacter stygius TaxID=1940610 RepID=A0A4D7B521_9HYPH|nr:acyl-CoA dehydrogenase [Phreatobacter stygius]QCI63322.1 acyl-CoA dehydrogenase [Phreatobacter stygius]
MSDANDHVKAWIGREETIRDSLGLTPARLLAATLDDRQARFETGDAVPVCWQWLYFLPAAPQGEIGPDGHPKRGGFLPPVELPQRMFAGAEITVHAPLRFGLPAERRGIIRDVTPKTGKSGPLVFVTVDYEFHQDGRHCLTERQSIVYKDAGRPQAAGGEAGATPSFGASWSRRINPDPVLLFRFSALTFNSHRIHYDRPYATEVEHYPDLVVHGPLIAVCLADLLRVEAGRPLSFFKFRAEAPLFVTAPFEVVGRAAGEAGAELKAVGPGGVTAMSASAIFA